MVRLTRLFILLALLLASCVPTKIPVSITSTPTVALTETPLPSSTPLPILTITLTFLPQSTSTITRTPRPTLSPEQYPLLKNLVLTIDDLFANPKSRFSEIFSGVTYVYSDKRKRDRPLIRDLTREFVAKNNCDLDCSKQSWAVADYGVAVYFTMIRTIDSKSASSISQIYFDHAGTNVWFRMPNISENGYRDVPALNTWVVEFDSHYQSLGTTYGSIVILIDMYKKYPGDDFVADVELMLEAANLQISKLKLSGITSDP
jgi:hypothetical protein